jgi:hypothetical protein
MLTLFEMLPSDRLRFRSILDTGALYLAAAARSDSLLAGFVRIPVTCRHKGVVPVLRHRAISLMLILVSSIFALRVYLLAPWYLDRTAFLARPLAFVAFPLFVVGCILWLRPSAYWPRLIFPLLLIAF